MMRWLCPKESLDPLETEHGMRMLVRDAVFAQSMTVLTTGAFVVAFALLLGASNVVVGVLAGIAPAGQALQIPAVLLVERLRQRKAIALITLSISRLALLGIAVMPWFAPASLAIPVFLVFLVTFAGMGALGGCAFNSWFRDVVPDHRLNQVLTRRFTWATLTGALFSFAGAYGVDFCKDHLDNPIFAYSILFALGSLSGLFSVFYLMRTPEPRMPKPAVTSFRALVSAPIKDRPYRRLLVFLWSWNFGMNFAMPFFTVFMIERLALNMTAVLGMWVLGQMFNVLFFGVWARLTDRFSNKSVLALVVPLYFFSFLLWPFTTLPGWHVMTLPLLLIIHMVSGMSMAGVSLCATNLIFKSAPFGRAASYIAMNALVSGTAAFIAPVLAGCTADCLASYELRIGLSWLNLQEQFPLWEMPTLLDIRGIDFVFLIGFVFGLICIRCIAPLHESGAVFENIGKKAFFEELMNATRALNALPGIRLIAAPLRRLRDATPARPASVPAPETVKR